ncbi:hypothetical protein [Oceanicaulis sp.]|uniref:hypothetical protein n=1 Tax=Oceanicaulis sp. TaxID=1924941 RepID=UPI003BAC6077
MAAALSSQAETDPNPIEGAASQAEPWRAVSCSPMGNALDARSHDRRSPWAHQQMSDGLITGYGAGLMKAISEILRAHRLCRSARQAKAR